MVWDKYCEMAKKVKRTEIEYMGICKVFMYASCEYESKFISFNPVPDTAVVEFIIRNNYIEQCDFLTVLGIEVNPKMIDEVRRETLVRFPFSLFSEYTEEDVLEKINTLSLPKKKCRIKN